MLEEGRDDEAEQQSAKFFLLPSPFFLSKAKIAMEKARVARDQQEKLLYEQSLL
jgi:hypothetical protein